METKRTDANQVIPLQLRNTFWNFLEHCSVQSAMLSCHCGYCRRRPLITVFERGNNRSKDTNNYPAEEGRLPSSAAGNLPKQKPWRRTRKIKRNRKRFVFCLHSTTDDVHILWLRPHSFCLGWFSCSGRRQPPQFPLVHHGRQLIHHKRKSRTTRSQIHRRTQSPPFQR